MSHLTAIDIAFMMVGCQQLVLAFGWAIGTAVFELERRPAAHWAASALMTGVSLLVFVEAAQTGSEPLRALANLCVVSGILLMERGVRHFVGRPVPVWPYLLVLAAVAVVSWLGLARPDLGAVRVAFVSFSIGIACAAIAWYTDRYARGTLGLPYGRWLALPLLLGALVFAVRGARAVAAPGTVVAELEASTSLNVGSAIVFLVTGLVFHLSLVALVGVRLMAKLQRLSRSDGLTGLYNRRTIEELVHDEARRAVRNFRPFAVLMIDADHFKSINDRHGHAAGDDALRHLATVLRAQMRDVDRVGRFGGEEFVALLPGTSAAEALSAAERLREALLRRGWSWNGDACGLTVSIGVAAWRGPNDTVDELLKRADAALYRAKALGRNRHEGGE